MTRPVDPLGLALGAGVEVVAPRSRRAALAATAAEVSARNS
ncbi:MAG: hypothetical protein ABR511_03485 [Acidimicrobiales bacterium]